MHLRLDPPNETGADDKGRGFELKHVGADFCGPLPCLIERVLEEAFDPVEDVRDVDPL